MSDLILLRLPPLSSYRNTSLTWARLVLTGTHLKLSIFLNWSFLGNFLNYYIVIIPVFPFKPLEYRNLYLLNYVFFFLNLYSLISVESISINLPKNVHRRLNV